MLTPDSEADKNQPECPRCGQAMAPGFIAVSAGVNWVDHIGWFDSSPYKGEPLLKLPFAGTGTPHLKAWRCMKCAVVLADYGAGIIHGGSRASKPGHSEQLRLRE